MNPSRVKKATACRAPNADKACLEALLSRGLQPLYCWLREQAEKRPEAHFQPGNTLENPLSLYLGAHLHGEHVGISNQTVAYRGERLRLPQAFVQFLQAINREFRHQHPTTGEVRDWMDRLKIELEPGAPVWWHDAPRGGYGSFAPVIAVVVKHGPAKIGIAALKKDGSWVPRWVAPTRLSPRQ